jgi:hypothetical protein
VERHCQNGIERINWGFTGPAICLRGSIVVVTMPMLVITLMMAFPTFVVAFMPFFAHVVTMIFMSFVHVDDGRLYVGRLYIDWLGLYDDAGNANIDPDIDMGRVRRSCSHQNRCRKESIYKGKTTVHFSLL